MNPADLMGSSSAMPFPFQPPPAPSCPSRVISFALLFFPAAKGCPGAIQSQPDHPALETRGLPACKLRPRGSVTPCPRDDDKYSLSLFRPQFAPSISEVPVLHSGPEVAPRPQYLYTQEILDQIWVCEEPSKLAPVDP